MVVFYLFVFDEYGSCHLLCYLGIVQFHLGGT
jgi:hypothetical protein